MSDGESSNKEGSGDSVPSSSIDPEDEDGEFGLGVFSPVSTASTHLGGRPGPLHRLPAFLTGLHAILVTNEKYTFVAVTLLYRCRS